MIEKNKFEVHFNEIFDKSHDLNNFEHKDNIIVLIVSLPLFQHVWIVYINEDN